jgi:signal transduction histidine kinase
VQSLRSELSLQQINALRQQGTGISRISRLNLLKIRIKLPPLAEQHKILFESRESLTKGKENKLDSDEFNFIATLKHTLKQPLAALSEDFNVLRTFLLQKSENGILSKDEIIVEVFDEDDASTLEKHSLMATLSRCQRMINNAHDHLNKAEQLLKIDSLKPKFEITSIKTLLLKLQEDCPGIEVEFKGRDYELNIDKYSFRIMLDNFIENANKHGFKDMKNPRILFRTEIERDKFDMEYVKIEYLNNGEALSEEITTDKFLRKHSKSNKSAGDGYGGHLINRISQMHKAIIEIDSLAAEKEIDYNVCFNIYLPKLN